MSQGLYKPEAVARLLKEATAALVEASRDGKLEGARIVVAVQADDVIPALEGPGQISIEVPASSIEDPARRIIGFSGAKGLG